MSRLDQWHERQRRLYDWLQSMAAMFELQLTPQDQAEACAKLGLALGVPLLLAPLLTAWLYGFKASGAAAYYWTAATAFGGALLADLRARELAQTA